LLCAGIAIPLEPLKVGAQFGRALATQVAVFLEHLRHNFVKLRRQIGITCEGGIGVR